MRLYAIFLILNIQLSHIYAFPPNPDVLGPWIKGNKKGYECGNIFVFEPYIGRSISHAQISTSLSHKLPQIYEGEIFGESNAEEYYFWPINEKGSLIPSINKKTKYNLGIIVAKNSVEQVGVVARTDAQDYTKCIRWDILPEEPSYSNGGIPNGYLCGQKKFHCDTIDKNVAEAKKHPEGTSKYPSPYIGTLYPEDSGYLLWPISEDKYLYATRICNYLNTLSIHDSARKLAGVVVKGHKSNKRNYIRCTPTIMPQEAAASDQNSELSVPPLRIRFLCDDTYFHTGDLEKIAEGVKESTPIKGKQKYPFEYKGPPFNKPCLILPLSKGGNAFKKGTTGNFRLILTPDYEVMEVAKLADNNYWLCSRVPIKPKIYPDTSDYQCRDKTFTHQHLVMAAEEACLKLGKKSRNIFPATYEGSNFMVGGPYFTYPVFKHSVFRKASGPYRVVINRNCEVAGALNPYLPSINGGYTHDILNRFLKCHRVANGLLPDDFFSDPANIVIEY